MQRRTFLAAAAPAIHATAKSGHRRPVLGSGAYTYEAIHDWARLPRSLALGNTHGICEDAQGHLYVAHTVHRSSQARDALLVFDEKGKLVRRWGSEFQGGAHGLHLAREGRDEFLYLVDTGKGRQSGIDPAHTWMVKMTLRGEEVFRIGYPKESPHYKLDKDGRPATKFSPTNVALAPNGDIYIADGYGSYFINQYDAKGAFLRSFGGQGTAAGQLASPHGLILDRRGPAPSLLVADRSNHRLQRFTLDGRHLAFHTGVNLPCHLHEQNGVMVIPDLAARVTLLSPGNQVIAHLGEDTTGNWMDLRKRPRTEFLAGKFVSPHGACFDHAGNIFVVEWVEVGRITKLRKLSA
ncbi:MAG: hypothetical protein ACK6DY_18360 [Acidobacteriota bacterium]|nr:hypothetical protein [Bryobacteraceae bacterium CoA2 C42]